MDEMSSLLQQSVALYQSLLEQSSALPKLLRHLSSDDVDAYISQYHETLEKTRILDASLMEKIKKSHSSLGADPLFLQRKQLMENLAENNTTLFSQLSGRLAVISSEMTQIRKARNAASGYSPGAAGRNGHLLKVSG